MEQRSLSAMVAAEFSAAGSHRCNTSPELNAALLAACRAVVRDRQMTFADLGKAIDRDPSSCRKWLTGKTSHARDYIPRLSLGVAEKMARWLDAGAGVEMMPAASDDSRYEVVVEANNDLGSLI